MSFHAGTWEMSKYRYILFCDFLHCPTDGSYSKTLRRQLKQRFIQRGSGESTYCIPKDFVSYYCTLCTLFL